MIPFQFQTFWRLLVTPGPMVVADFRGLLRRVGFFLFFPVFQIINTLLLSIDRIWCNFGTIQVKAPLFVISPPRSGSTLMQRLLAKDQGRFTSFSLWQSIFPALSFQVLIRALSGTGFGRWLETRFNLLQDRFFSNSDRYHKIRLQEVEEDEILFAHACASELLANVFPIPEIWRDYRHFDEIPDPRRSRLMAFYLSCVQRHLWLDGPHLQFLSKNPPFCNKVGSLKDTFPDARFVFLVRHPEEAIGSVLSMLHAFRSAMGLKAKSWKRANFDPGILQFSVDCYRHALRALDAMPASDYQIILYQDLVEQPESTILAMYERFGYTVSDAYRAVLAEQQRKAKSHKPGHHHSIEDFGLTSLDVEALLPEIYERFGFEKRSRRRENKAESA